MQSTLLSPSESHAFQSFLSSMDYPAESVSISATEWALYNNNATMYSAQDDLLESEPNLEHRQALTKATKDLMSLDSDSWDAGASMMDHHPVVRQQHQVYDANGHIASQYDQQHEQRMLIHHQQVIQHQQQQQQRHNSFATTHDVFPFLQSKVQQRQPHPQPPHLHYPSHPMQQQQHLTISPISSGHSSPNSPHSPYTFQQQHNSMPIPMHHPPQQQQQVQISPQQSPASASRAKRMPAAVATSSRSTLQSSSSSSNPNAAASSSSSHLTLNGTRPATNGTNGASKRQRSSTSPTTANSNSQSQQEAQSSVPPKQTLLSPSQKKANHIQSEQKRRANIRRGYEALCETVPALREAIREEEEAERNGSLMNTGQRKRKGKKNGKEGSDEREKDRLDGRAGPRSENVVLSKTIDHIEALLADRSSLLARLHRARSSLTPGHPALTPLMPDPPWEREWKGGEGKLGEEDPDGEGASEGEDGEDGE